MCIRDSHQHARDMLDGFAVITNGRHQGQVVVDAPDEEVAKPYPKQCGEPSPYYCDCRAHDWTCACNGCKVMTEENELICRHIVAFITTSKSRCWSRTICLDNISL